MVFGSLRFDPPKIHYLCEVCLEEDAKGEWKKVTWGPATGVRVACDLCLTTNDLIPVHVFKKVADFQIWMEKE